MTWLYDYFRSGYQILQQGGNPLPRETIINFATGATLTDNPVNAATVVNIGSGFAVTGTGFPYVLSSATQGFAITLTGDISQGSLSGSNVPLTVVALQGNAVSNTSPTTNYVLAWSGTHWAPTNPSGLEGVTGTGLWYSTSGTLGSAAITLTGDISQGALSTNNLPLTVTALQGHAVSNTAPTTSYVLTWNGSAWAPAVSAVTEITGTGLWYSASGTLNSAAITLTGDLTQGSLSGSNLTISVTSIHGSTVPAGGSLVTGNTLFVSGSSALSYGALNLAGGSGYVTGALPVGNLAHGTAAQLLITNSGATAPAWVSMSGDVTITAAGVTTLGAIDGVTLPSPSGTNTYLQYSGSALSWAAAAAVTGTGLWYSASGSLNSAAITLTGDVSQGALSGSNVPLTVTALQTFAVNSGTPSSANLLIYHSSAWTPTAMSGNATISSTGVVTVTAFGGVTISGTPAAGNSLIATSSSAATWEAVNLAGGSNWVTGALPLANLANGTAGQYLITNSGASAPVWTTLTGDVAASTSTVGLNYIISVSGASGTAGTVNLGDGTHNLSLTQVTSVQNTPPTLAITSSAGLSTSGVTNAGASGAFLIAAGTGGNGGTGIGTGGAGGNLTLQAGNGGNAGSGGSTAGGVGGNLVLVAGSGGNAGSGGAAAAGQFVFQFPLYNGLVIDYGVTTASTFTYSLGDGQHNVNLVGTGDPSTGAPFTFTIAGAVGLSQTATAGQAGQPLVIGSGAGGAGQGTSHSGGAGAALTLSAGAGGLSTGTANNASGGAVTITTGTNGTGGSGTTGSAGALNLQIGGSNKLVISATGTVTLSNLGTGVVQSSSVGLLTSSIGTSGQMLLTNSGATAAAWVSLSQDVTVSSTGVATVVGLNGVSLPAGSGTNTVLQYNAGAYTWATVSGSSVTWANDLSGSSNTHQYVIGLDGNGTGAVSLGTGAVNLALTQTASTQATPPTLTIASSAGFPAASASGAGGKFTVQAGAGTVASSGTANGGAGGALALNAGTGAAGLGGSSNGGAGGAVTIATGTGGAKVGAGTAGATGKFTLTMGGTNELVIDVGVSTTSTMTWLLGDGTNNIAWTAPASLQSTPPAITWNTSTGLAAASAGAGGAMTIQTGVGANTSTSTGTGGAGGAWNLTSGAGGTGGGTSGNAGAGGLVTITAGAGGNTAGSGNGGAGGGVTINTGNGGTSTGGTAGVAGAFIVELGSNIGNVLKIAGATNDLLILGSGSTAQITYRASGCTLAAPPTDTATTVFTFTGQPADTGAVSNVNGGAINLEGGSSTSNGVTGLRGPVRLSFGATTNNTLCEVAEVAVGQRVVSLAKLGTVSSTNIPANAGDGVVFVGNAATNPTAAPATGFTMWSATGFPNIYVPGAANAQLLGQSGTQGGATNKLAKTIYNLTTTSTSAQTIATIAVPASGQISVCVYCTGRLTAAAFTPYFNVGFATVANNAGTLSSVQSTLLTAMPSSSGATLSFTTSGTNLLVQIAPNAATSTTWEAVIDIITT